jgi:hypothetical protein
MILAGMKALQQLIVGKRYPFVRMAGLFGNGPWI